MSRSIRKLLNEWEHDSGKNIRIINDRMGKPVMQVREMMGISELELEGRPDGSFYMGFETVLDEVSLRIEKNESSFVLFPDKNLDIEVIPVKTLSEALEHALSFGKDRENIIERIKDLLSLPASLNKPLPKKQEHGI